MGSRIITGDCVEAMKSMPSESVHAIVTDPPYGLEFIGIEREEEYVRIAQARIAHSEKKAVVRKQQKGLMDFD
jgi:DNA modification methylase